MTDYDAQIALLKMTALRQLRSRATAPFSVAQGDLPGFFTATLDAVAGPFAEKLMAALIDRDAWRERAEHWIRSCNELIAERDAWKARVEEKQRQIERWIVSCNEIQANWEEEHRKLAAAEEALERAVA